MALQGCHTCIKYLMFAFNFLFWLLGCVILGIGIWISVDPGSLKKLASDHSGIIEYFKTLEYSNYDSIGAYVLIAVGSIIMVIGFLGCCGAIRESQCMLATFFVLLFIIFAVLLAIGIYLIVVKDKIKPSISKSLKSEIDKAKDGKDSYISIIQSEFKCCGADQGQPDWGSDAGSKCSGAKQPCTSEVYNAVIQNLIIIAGVATGVAAVMLLGMVFSMLLCCAIKENM